jgi:hypothetical protein
MTWSICESGMNHGIRRRIQCRERAGKTPQRVGRHRAIHADRRVEYGGAALPARLGRRLRPGGWAASVVSCAARRELDQLGRK